ncbi:hypothetical protein C8J56DRAFT_1049145 [Mycena floridula]|nr:hypothetical protein C8J56DRAFT_1049145 [Mycena floridula]
MTNPSPQQSSKPPLRAGSTSKPPSHHSTDEASDNESARLFDKNDTFSNLEKLTSLRPQADAIKLSADEIDSIELVINDIPTAKPMYQVHQNPILGTRRWEALTIGLHQIDKIHLIACVVASKKIIRGPLAAEFQLLETVLLKFRRAQ